MEVEDEFATESTDDGNIRENVDFEEEISEIRKKHERRLSEWRKEMDILFNEKVPKSIRKKKEDDLKIAQEKKEEARKMAEERARERSLEQLAIAKLEEAREATRKMAEAINKSEINESGIKRTQVRGNRSERRLFPGRYDKNGFLKPEFNPDLKGVDAGPVKDRFRKAFRDGWEEYNEREEDSHKKREETKIHREKMMEEEVIIFLMEIETIQRIKQAAEKGLSILDIQLPKNRLPHRVVGRRGPRGKFVKGYEGEFPSYSGLSLRFDDFYKRICEYLSERGISADIDIPQVRDILGITVRPTQGLIRMEFDEKFSNDVSRESSEYFS